MNPSSALAAVLVDELVRQGVCEAVLCPGSRSAPLAYALEAADRAGRLRLHVRVDERSAGFLAVGLGKLTRVPAVVVTTSGTAVANLHPAVLEAHHAEVPILLLTADRPPELRGTGANQTTSQPGIFGMPVRWFHEFGAPERRPGQNAIWRSSCARAVAAALGLPGGQQPGPAHLNVPLREPLVPDAEVAPAAGTAAWPESLDGRPGSAPWVTLPPRHVDADREPGPPATTSTLTDVPRTLVVVGDLPEPHQAVQAVDWAAHHGWPVVAEPFGDHARDAAIPHGALVLSADDWLEDHLPDRVMTVGRITLSRAVAGLTRRPGLVVETVTPSARWVDPSHVVSRVHSWDVIGSSSPPESDPGWARDWQLAGEAVAKAVAAAPPCWPSGLAVAQVLGDALAPGATLFVGSSNAARDLDLGCACLSRGVRVVASRGLAGIDGCVSTAIGVALASPSPSFALLGDLTFLHDANGLLVGPQEPVPDLTIVVANDDGGGIFTLLEPGAPELAGRFERIFGTPTGTDIAALCRAHGVAHQRMSTRNELEAAVADAPNGIRVLEVPVDRSGHREAHARLRAAAADALSRLR